MASPDEIWLVDFGDPFRGEQAFHRPALVIGPTALFGANFPFVVVVPLTTTDRGLSLHVPIEPTPETGLDEPSFAQCELLRSISARRLRHRLGIVDPTTSAQVDLVVRRLLGH